MRTRAFAAVVAAAAAACAASAQAHVSPSPRPPLPHPRADELARLLGLGLPVYCGGRSGTDVALTFDDGPGPYTQLSLRILRRDGARATFFLVGKEIAYWPTGPRAELRLGALGDHTWSHRFLPALPRPRIYAELRSAKELIERDAHTRIRFFRPPYGARTPLVDAAAHELHLIEVLWSVDSRDSEGAPWDVIAQNVLHAVRPGSIVLFHENHGQTIRALKFAVLPALRRLGLHAVTLPQLLDADPPSVAQLRAGARGCGAPEARSSAP